MTDDDVAAAYALMMSGASKAEVLLRLMDADSPLIAMPEAEALAAIDAALPEAIEVSGVGGQRRNDDN